VESLRKTRFSPREE